MFGEDAVALVPPRIAGQGPGAERRVVVDLVLQEGGRGAMAQGDAVVRVDRQRRVEHARGVAVAPVVEHVAGAVHDRLDAALVAFEHAVEERLGLRSVEHHVGAADAAIASRASSWSTCVCSTCFTSFSPLGKPLASP